MHSLSADSPSYPSAPWYLRCSVSGGLEELAQEEILALLPGADLIWSRGNSGSHCTFRLPWIFFRGVIDHVSIQSDGNSNIDVRDVGKRLLPHLRFVEYVSLLVQSLDAGPTPMQSASDIYNDGDFQELERISLMNPSSYFIERIDRERFNLARMVGSSCQKFFPDCVDLGLDPLPGILLPTPNIPNDAKSSKDIHEGEGDEDDIDKQRPSMPKSSSTFAVNTIYTRDIVAKAVVQSFLELVKDWAMPNWDWNEVLWLDAGTGDGALLRHLPKYHRLGVDICPAPTLTTGVSPDEILSANYLTVTSEILRKKLREQMSMSSSTVDPYSHLCVISNPPFSEGNRGDNSIIVKFLNHSISLLGASFVALIVPTKFARSRIWASLGMATTTKDGRNVQLLARFQMPTNSFVDPSNDSKPIHIHSTLLLFGVEGLYCPTAHSAWTWNLGNSKDGTSTTPGSFYLTAKRDKSEFPNISTTSLARTIAKGLEPLKVIPLTCERQAEYQLTVRLVQGTTHKLDWEHQHTHAPPQTSEEANSQGQIEFWLLLNPQRPLSLANSLSRHIPNHSLGWMSTSVKPGVANAMLQMALSPAASTKNGSLPTNNRVYKDCALVVNAMSGEGTIELEAQYYAAKGKSCSHFFMITGDKKESAAIETKRRLDQLQSTLQSDLHDIGSSPFLVDVVIWDAQRLPLRKEICDLFLADLPFAGSMKASQRQHQEPSGVGGRSMHRPLQYSSIMSEAVRILRPLGQAVLLSADSKALVRSTAKLHWKATTSKSNINVGGLCGQLLIMSKLMPCWSDLSVWMDNADSTSLAVAIYERMQFILTNRNGTIEEKCRNTTSFGSPLLHVELVDVYHHEKHNKWSHCYRLHWEGSISKVEAKVLEKQVRSELVDHPLNGMLGLR